ncbi:hypothetical protein NKH99_32340 [Mesorhizobium sp. M0854]|uniref:hypothetical protein n=1 Tax=Mesorhizobium sp. M0854 TaxID=2957013 RepID=UPI00333C91F9
MRIDQLAAEARRQLCPFIASRGRSSGDRQGTAETRAKAADERIATLTTIVKMLERSRYGRRSERLDISGLTDEKYAFVLEEIESGSYRPTSSYNLLAIGKLDQTSSY